VRRIGHPVFGLSAVGLEGKDQFESDPPAAELVEAKVVPILEEKAQATPRVGETDLVAGFVLPLRREAGTIVLNLQYQLIFRSFRHN
jgi:hypothetical protein